MMIGPQFAFEAEIGVFEENAGVEEAGTADGELVEGGPAAGRVVGGGGGEKIGDEGGDGSGAFGFVANGVDERGEFGGNAS